VEAGEAGGRDLDDLDDLDEGTVETGPEVDNNEDMGSSRKKRNLSHLTHLNYRKATPIGTHHTEKELGLVLEDDKYRDMDSSRKKRNLSHLSHLNYRKATPIGTLRRQVLEEGIPTDKVCSRRARRRMAAATNSHRKMRKVESDTVCVEDNALADAELAWEEEEEEEAHRLEGMDSSRKDDRRDGKEGVRDGICCNHHRHRKYKKRHDALPSFEDYRPRHSQD
jgi:hypothetical protein